MRVCLKSLVESLDILKFGLEPVKNCIGQGECAGGNARRFTFRFAGVKLSLQHSSVPIHFVLWQRSIRLPRRCRQLA